MGRAVRLDVGFCVVRVSTVVEAFDHPAVDGVTRTLRLTVDSVTFWWTMSASHGTPKLSARRRENHSTPIDAERPMVSELLTRLVSPRRNRSEAAPVEMPSSSASSAIVTRLGIS